MHRFLLALLLLLAFPLAASAETFKDSQRAFSISLPDDWAALSQSDVDTYVQRYSPDENLQCFAGFERGDLGLLLISSSPYPQDATYSAFTLLQIQQLAAALTGANAGEFHTATRPLADSMGAGVSRQVTCCTEPPSIIIDYQYPQRDLRSHSIAFLGRDHVVLLHFFTRPGDFAAVQPALNDIATSFHYSLSQSSDTKTTFHAAGDYTTLGIYLFVGLLIAASLFIVRYLFRRQAY